MKIKDLIEHLNTFDPDANVVIFYDSCYAYTTKFRKANGDDVYAWREIGVREGDAVMDVG